MATKPESTLWKNLREGTKDLGVFWTRLESWSSPGVPDLHGILDGHAFWLELKVHRLNSLNKIALRPHQIAWQIRYSRYSGNVWNLVGHPSSRTINIFRGARAMERCLTVWSSWKGKKGSPVAWSHPKHYSMGTASCPSLTRSSSRWMLP